MESKQIDWSRTDALIFDMDGTLWDAVDTYARIWNEVFLRAGREGHITRESLIGNIGIPIPRILANLFPDIEPDEAARFSAELAREEPALLARYGGTPYLVAVGQFLTREVLRDIYHKVDFLVL